MYGLEKITENNWYINSPTKVGIWQCAPGEVWLIDSGSDKDAARKVWKHISEQGWTVQGILATHSNADHVGGCKLITQRSGCKVYSAPIERAVIENSVLEPSMLYGGYPPKALRNKFLMAESVPCEDIAAAPLPDGLKIIPLGGHFLDMFGVLTPQGVFFCADAVFSRTVVEKYHINFVYDVAAALDCLEHLSEIECKWVLPAHAELTDCIAELAKLNRDKMLEICSLLKSICAREKCFDDIIKEVFDLYGLELSFAQYVLVGSSLRSYLAFLLDRGELEALFFGNKMQWRSL